MTKHNSDELREKVKRFCRTEQAADNLVKVINSELNNLLTRLEGQAITVTNEQKPFGQLFKAVPASAIEEERKKL
jgi:hypothetical protein